MKKGEPFVSLGNERTIRKGKGSSILDLPSDYVVIDLETTGLSPDYSEIIELAAIKVENNQIVDKYQQLVKPDEEIDEFITSITGITNEMVKDAPKINEVLDKYLEFIGDATILGHNVSFDVNFVFDNALNCYDKTFSNDYIDTMRISRKLFKEERHHRLQDLIKRFELGGSQEHRALSDCDYTKKTYDWMVNYISQNSIDTKELFKKRDHNHNYKDLQATVTEFDEDNPFYQKTVVFTGKLEKYSRKDAAQIVLNCGGEFKDSVAKDVNYLVVGDTDFRERTSKMDKAYALKEKGFDIEVNPESMFYQMLEENN